MTAQSTIVSAAISAVPSLLASDEEWAAYQARCDALDLAFQLRDSEDYVAASDAIAADYAALDHVAFAAKYAR